MQLSIQADFADVQRQLAKLRDDIGRRALASALNKTVAQARTQMQREIAREYAVSVAYARERLRIRKAFTSGRFELSAELAAGNRRGRSANIIRFVEKSVTLAAARRRAKDGTLGQLRVRVKRGAFKPLRDAFIGNKGRTVFKRTGRKRLPIEPVQTIDVAQMFNTRRINQVVVRSIRANLPRIFASEARFYIDRFNRSGR